MAKAIAFVALLTCYFFPVSVVRAEEFGNVFGNNEVVERSRNASARAIDGIILSLYAVRARELKESSGEKELLEASQRLFEAADAMSPILDTDFPEIPLDQEQVAIAIRFAMSSPTLAMFGIDKVTTYKELFAVFRNMTIHVGEICKEASATPADTSVFAKISEPIQQYFALANFVSQIGRAINR